MKALILLIALTWCGCGHAVIFTYTDTDTSTNSIALGYPVPQPIDSLTPIDGFRSYQSLHLRHQQLTELSDFIFQLDLGATVKQRTIYGYQIGDQDNQTKSGEVEGAALINGGIHAREWQTPEATTGFIEALHQGQNDQHIAQYLLENLNLVIVPVLNIDGFIQTQRFANKVTASRGSPRDGRMRRKNMAEVDEDLDTLDDNLLGVDLNRNNAPYWATGGTSSSPQQDSIVHHGSGPASEPETKALMQAASFAGEDRLRFYMDTHSFTQIYFAPFTANSRRNTVTTDVATIMRAANNNKYDYGPSSAGAGIGSTDEYFANTYEIPSYTLEIEPQSSGAEYGGFGVSHDGFILPASEASRMRNETTKATFAGLYAIAQIPYLLRVEVWNTQSNSLTLGYEWQNQGQQRILQNTEVGELLSNTEYALHLVFNKPMRWIEDGQVTGFTDLSEALGINIDLVAIVDQQNLQWTIDPSAGQWMIGSGIRRYNTDTFSVPFQLDDNFDWQTTSLLSVRVDTTDIVGQKLDTDPSTVIDWQTGAWTNYEDTMGNSNTDSGGIDNSFRLIDDGSPLYESQPSNPTTPEPDMNNASGSGGTLGIMLGMLILLGLVRRLTVA